MGRSIPVGKFIDGALKAFREVSPVQLCMITLLLLPGPIGTMALIHGQQANAPAVAQEEKDIRAVISAELPGFRLAEVGDYVSALSPDAQGERVIQQDFNRDGKADWAIVVINEQLREYRIYYRVSDQDKYQLIPLFTRRWRQSPPIQTPMFLKRAGDAGMANRVYKSMVAPLNRRETQNQMAIYESVPAIEVWTGQTHDESDKDLEDLSYCSSTWYYDKGQLKQFEACD